MRYPVLSKTRAAEIAAKRINGVDIDIDPDVEWIGAGVLIDLTRIERVSDDIHSRHLVWTDSDLDRFEGLMAQHIYDALGSLPIDVLDDRGFWRFLSLKYFWDFIIWRQPSAFASSDEQKYMRYIDGSKNTDTILVRMFLRASALGGRDTGRLAGGIPEAADFWYSHILRVQTGSAPHIATAFAERQLTDRLTTNPVRAAAKRLTRTWTNVILHVYDETEARDVVNHIWRIP